MFFVPINFERDFLYKIGANFEFLAKTGLVSDLFLKRFLYILMFSEISFSFQFEQKIEVFLEGISLYLEFQIFEKSYFFVLDGIFEMECEDWIFFWDEIESS